MKPAWGPTAAEKGGPETQQENDRLCLPSLLLLSYTWAEIRTGMRERGAGEKRDEGEGK